ncbi:MAG: tRNA uridine-5-carboxymethylaminomethyl(34) synthesis GTPase MnmE [Planctomycetota bacterium]
MTNDDTIVAIASPPGPAARGIVRLSGPAAFAVARAVARWDENPGAGAWSAVEASVDLGEGADLPARLFLMKAPRTYTREDVVEFHTVGSPPALAEIVRRCVAAGARPAPPGEFTRRAFLNGRIDLAQAEAVAALIRARSEAEGLRAIRTMDGALSRDVASVRERLQDILAEIEAALDFAEEDIPEIRGEALSGPLTGIRADLERLACFSAAQSPSPEGVSVVLAGRPNAGKSTLFNRLVGFTRAVVSEVPGTTRDPVGAAAEIDGLRFRFVDTAGLAAKAGGIEEAAMARARAAARDADRVVVVMDGSAPLAPEDDSLLGDPPPGKRIIVINKSDLPSGLDLGALAARVAGSPILALSALTGDGVDALQRLLVEDVRRGRVGEAADGCLVTARQEDCLVRARDAAAAAAGAVAAGEGLEVVALAFRETLAALGELTGEAAGEDILDRIFSRFCVGK